MPTYMSKLASIASLRRVSENAYHSGPAALRLVSSRLEVNWLFLVVSPSWERRIKRSQAHRAGSSFANNSFTICHRPNQGHRVLFPSHSNSTMCSSPDGSHVGLVIPRVLSDMASSSSRSSIVSTRETSPASSARQSNLSLSMTPAPSEGLVMGSPGVELEPHVLDSPSEQTRRKLSSNLQPSLSRPSPCSRPGDESTEASSLSFVDDQSKQDFPSLVRCKMVSSAPDTGGITGMAAGHHERDILNCCFDSQRISKNTTPQPSASCDGINHPSGVFCSPRNIGSCLGSGTAIPMHEFIAQHASSSTSMAQRANDLPQKLLSLSHSRFGQAGQACAQIRPNRPVQRDIATAVDDHVVNISPGSFQQVNHPTSEVTRLTDTDSLTGISSLTCAGNLQTTKSGRHLVLPDPQPRSSTPASCSLVASSWSTSALHRNILDSRSMTEQPRSGKVSPRSAFNSSQTRCFARTSSQPSDNIGNANNKQLSLTSPFIAPVQFAADKAFQRQYVPIANSSRAQTTPASASRDNTIASSQPAATFLRDRIYPSRPTSLSQNVNALIQLADPSEDNFEGLSSSSSHRITTRSATNHQHQNHHHHHLPSRSIAHIPLTRPTMHPANGLVIAKGDMDQAMAYCYDRGDGTFTRLVPVDLLPVELEDIPARVASDEGMIVLPVPRRAGRDGQPANSQLAPQIIATVSDDVGFDSCFLSCLCDYRASYLVSTALCPLKETSWLVLYLVVAPSYD